jgi:hypothetical protein
MRQLTSIGDENRPKTDTPKSERGNGVESEGEKLADTERDPMPTE